MAKLTVNQIKEYLEAQIRNRHCDIACFLTDMDGYYHDPSKVLEKAQGAVMHKERATALKEVLSWIQDRENR